MTKILEKIIKKYKGKKIKNLTITRINNEICVMVEL